MPSLHSFSHSMRQPSLLASLLILPFSFVFGETGSSSSASISRDSAQIAIGKSSLPAPSSDAATLRGASAGYLGNALIRVGGVNDHGVPVSEAEILSAVSSTNGSGDTKRTEWKILPFKDAPAWAAKAQHGKDLIMAGGLTGSGPTTKVTCVGMNGEKITTTDPPPLPHPLPGAGAAVLGDKLYVRSAEHTSELQSPMQILCLLLLENKTYNN